VCFLLLVIAAKGVPTVGTHDGRTVRYPDPLTKVNDTLQLDLTTGRPVALIKFDVGAQVMITGGRNTGRVGTIVNRERHLGGFDIVHIKDSLGHEFATRLSNCFAIGAAKGKAPISLPKGKGVKLTIAEERDRRLKAKATA
jgi:small subunit ribosomal protein S4e